MNFLYITALGNLVVTHDLQRLENMQRAVGGYIEAVSFVFEGKPFVMWLNETGKLKTLPMNEEATVLVEDRIADHDYIAGDVFITGPADDDGDATGLSEDDIIGLVGAMNKAEV